MLYLITDQTTPWQPSMKLMLFAVSLLAAITAASPDNVTMEEWNLFKAKHGKVYRVSLVVSDWITLTQFRLRITSK